jgi:nucleotide-binding universal stress UspA family protein
VARWWGATLTVLHVYTPVPEVVPALEPAGLGIDGGDDPDLHPLERVTSEFARRAGADPQTTRVVVRVGWPADEIVTYAGAGEDRVVVIGTQGARGFRRMMLGSVAEKVVRTALCPVITVPPLAQASTKLPFKSILCPVDFSASSEHAVPMALSLARAGDAELTLLHVVQGDQHGKLPSYARTFSSPDLGAVRDEEGEARLRHLLPAESVNWCTPHVHLVHGTPGDEILKYAADTGPDLIVMGVRKRSGLDQALFGSTTNQVLRGAACPVLTERA